MADVFECDASPDQGLGFLEHLRVRHWSKEILRPPAFEQHRFPYLCSTEDRLDTWGVNGKSLRLDKYDHCGD